jgi:hypothetical protein
MRHSVPLAICLYDGNHALLTATEDVDLVD